MAGEATARGWPTLANTELVRDWPVKFDTGLDKIAADAAGEAAPVTALTGITASAGWSIIAGYVNGMRNGRFAHLEVQAAKTGAALGAAGANGNLVDSQVCTLSGPWAPDPAWTLNNVFHWGGGSYAGHGALVMSTGAVILTDAYPTSQVLVGDLVRCMLYYRLAA